MALTQSTHCLVVPFPGQGHINPMLNFSKRLQHKGIKPTLVTTQFMFNTTIHKLSDSILIETISDGYDDGGYSSAESFEAYMKSFKQVGSKALADLIEKRRGLGCPDICIIYEPTMPWVLDVAKEYGLFVAAFSTQSCAVATIYYHVYHGQLQVPLKQSKIIVPGLPMLKPADLPSFVSTPESYPVLLDLFVNQFSNIDKVDWFFCNTFYKLEEEALDLMAKRFQFKAIGPTVPSFYLDGRIKEDKEYGISMHMPSTSVCLEWLNKQQENSVVYVSFGSLAELGIEQMEELASGLKQGPSNFLWVVRASEQSKIPEKFLDETADKGLVVSWCPQLEVLAHGAIGCFITHCGWNSTLEALSLGVPMVAMPQWTDQNMNAKYVVDVWKTGVQAEPNEIGGIVGRGTMASCLREVMEGEKGREIRRNANKWREFASKAVDEGGSSDQNIDEFVANLLPSF